MRGTGTCTCLALCIDAGGRQYAGQGCAHAGHFLAPPLLAPNLHAAAPPAAAGLTGLMDPVEPGLACGSDTAHLALFGYDPRTYYRGRGAFESMGAGGCCAF